MLCCKGIAEHCVFKDLSFRAQNGRKTPAFRAQIEGCLVSKGSRINVNFADFWSGRWESNPRPKFGFTPPPRERGYTELAEPRRRHRCIAGARNHPNAASPITGAFGPVPIKSQFPSAT